MTAPLLYCHRAYFRHRYEVVVKLLLENGAEVNAEGGVYENALHAAFLRDNNVIMKLLMENGAEVNTEQKNIQGFYPCATPLQI